MYIIQVIYFVLCMYHYSPIMVEHCSLLYPYKLLYKHSLIFIMSFCAWIIIPQ